MIAKTAVNILCTLSYQDRQAILIQNENYVSKSHLGWLKTRGHRGSCFTYAEENEEAEK